MAQCRRVQHRSGIVAVMKYVANIDLANVAKQGGIVTEAKCQAAGVSLLALIRGRLVSIQRPPPKKRRKGDD